MENTGEDTSITGVQVHIHTIYRVHAAMHESVWQVIKK